MASILHNSGLHLWGDFETVDVRATLLKSTATPTKDHDYLSEVIASSQEISVTGFVRKTLAGKVRTVNDTTDLQTFTWDTIAWTGMSGTDQTHGWLTFYVYNASDSAAQLLASWDVADLAIGASRPAVSYGPPTNGLRIAQGVIA